MSAQRQVCILEAGVFLTVEKNVYFPNISFQKRIGHNIRYRLKCKLNELAEKNFVNQMFSSNYRKKDYTFLYIMQQG